jgi:hypothetical protein
MGNVVYFFLWVFSLILWYMTQISLPFFQDPIGYNIFGTSLHASASAAFPNDSIAKSLSVGSFNEPGVQVRVFDWAGLDWSLGIVGEQWLWVAVGLGLILLSALWFARFDPSREGRRRARRKPEEAARALGFPALHCPAFRRSSQGWPRRVPSWVCFSPSCACYSMAAAGGGGPSRSG